MSPSNFLVVASCLHCASSCVRLENGSNACVGFERFVTRVLSEGGVLLEFDSTDYDTMEALTNEINGRTRDVGVLLLGSATSAIVDANVFEEGPIWMEVTNLTYGDHQWNVSVVAMDGMLFVSALPCSLNCDLGISFELKDGFMATFATKSAIIADGLGRAIVTLHEADLPQMARVRDDGVLFEANFSIGLVVGSSITQTPVCVRRAKGAIGTRFDSARRAKHAFRVLARTPHQTFTLNLF